MNSITTFVSPLLPAITRERSTSICGRRERVLRMSTGAEQTNVAAGARVMYHGIQHCGFIVENTEKSKQFYMEVFGMEDDTHTRNPKLPFKGAFLKAGTSQIHLMELDNPDPKEGRPEHGGRDKHVAITLEDLNPLIASLESHNRHYTFSKSGRRAVFTRDLDSNALEFIEAPTPIPKE